MLFKIFYHCVSYHVQACDFALHLSNHLIAAKMLFYIFCTTVLCFVLDPGLPLGHLPLFHTLFQMCRRSVLLNKVITRRESNRMHHDCLLLVHEIQLFGLYIFVLWFQLGVCNGQPSGGMRL